MNLFLRWFGLTLFVFISLQTASQADTLRGKINAIDSSGEALTLLGVDPGLERLLSLRSKETSDQHRLTPEPIFLTISLEKMIKEKGAGILGDLDINQDVTIEADKDPSGSFWIARSIQKTQPEEAEAIYQSADHEEKEAFESRALFEAEPSDSITQKNTASEHSAEQT